MFTTVGIYWFDLHIKSSFPLCAPNNRENIKIICRACRNGKMCSGNFPCILKYSYILHFIRNGYGNIFFRFHKFLTTLNTILMLVPWLNLEWNLPNISVFCASMQIIFIYKGPKSFNPPLHWRNLKTTANKK